MSLHQQSPDDTAPSLRRVQGRICPKCGAAYPDQPGSPTACTRDGSVLVRASELAESVGDPMVGRSLDGRYTIVSKLGSGSMGTVYRARQEPMGREVAIKILRSDRAMDEAAKARFLREARTNSVLASPHTVTVFDFGESEHGELFLAMELLDGESVGQRIQRIKRIPPEMAVEVARQALASLAEAHAKGVVHRDLKPDNLFFAKVLSAQGQPQETVKVLDFGIAKMLGDNIEMNAIETQAGTVFGTPRYMSPEQAQAKPLDGRTDLYSLGVILYHMLTGRPPFTDDDAIIVMARHIKSTPKPFAEACPDARIPPDIERVVMRALSKEPAKRPDSADAMARELAAALEASRSMTSGVRASLGNIVPSVPPPSMPPPARSDDSLELPASPGSAGSLPKLLIGIAVGSVLALAIVLVWAWPKGGATQPPPRATTPAALATTPPTPALTTATTTALATQAPPDSATAPDPIASAHPVPTATTRATGGGARTSKPLGTGTKPPATATTATATTSSGRYGTFE